MVSKCLTLQVTLASTLQLNNQESSSMVLHKYK